MPGPIRKPLFHPARTQMITARSIEIFDTMMRERCSCAPGERFACPSCKRWERLDEELGVEMKVPVWRYPTISNPQGKNPYPVGHGCHRTWEPDHEGRELWLALAAASKEAKREARRAKAAATQEADPVADPVAPPEPPAPCRT